MAGMKDKLRSSACSSSSSAEEILSFAVSAIGTKTGKASLRSLIFSLPASSGLFSTLTAALHLAVSRSLDAFKKSLHRSDSTSKAASPGRSSLSPPPKRSRSSSGAQTPDAAVADVDGSGVPVSAETLVQLKNLKAYAYVAYLCFSHPKKRFAPSDLLACVQSLHDCLVLFEMDQPLLSQVATICEEWWKAKLPGRENLVSQSLPFLLSRSLTEGKKADVRRVYCLREAFLLFDYVDESIEDMRTLLVRCIIAPVYLKMEEGRKFVAFVLVLNGQLMKEALALIKSQIPFGRKSVLEGYADILFRAWKGSEGPLREEIEDGFLQGLIEIATYASTKVLAASVRRVLGGFVQQRMTEGVEKLLLRLVEPVLFRSLQVTNSNVRQNSLHLLLDLFSLEDPDMTKEAKESLVQKQFFLLEKLLVDDCPEVRSIAVEGSCRILHLFWEVISSSTITRFLSKIVDCMSHDICNEVRLSTINGIIYLLDNPQSLEILKVLLPRLGFLFFDPALSVRAAVVNLLLAIRDSHTIQFNKVVGLNDLLPSLAKDHPRVAKKITNLLIPSYFPSKLAIREACTRFIALIKRSPDAGARFCEFAFSEGSSSRSLMELAKFCINLAISPKGLAVEKADSLLIASSNICQSLSIELPIKQALSELLSVERLKRMLTAASSERAQTAVLNIASLVSAEISSGLHDDCMTIVRNISGLSRNVERQRVIKAVHKLMWSCGHFDEMFKQLASLLQKTSSNLHIRFGVGSTQETLRTCKKKKVRFPMKTSSRADQVNGKGLKKPVECSNDKDFVVAAAAAWQVKNLLTVETTRNAVLQSSVSGLAFSALGVITEMCIQQCIQLELLDVEPVLAYTTFAIFMSIQNVASAPNDISGTKDNDTTNSAPEEILDQALNHVINCADKLFSNSVFQKPNQVSNFEPEFDVAQGRKFKCREAHSGTPNPARGCEVSSFEVRRTENVVKLYSTIMKFVVDAVAIRNTNHNQTRCLKFTSDGIQHILVILRQIQKDFHNQEEVTNNQEESLKDVVACLKTLFSYAVKLLHLVLKNSGESSTTLLEAFCLANCLLDLFASTELCLGSRHASSIVSVAKPWFPVLILGLGYNQLAMSGKDGPLNLADIIGANFPLWLKVLGNTELYRDGDLSQDEGREIPKLEASVFQNLIETLLMLLKKGNSRIFDAVGGVILAALEVALKDANLSLVLGLIRFVCIRMLGKNPTPLEELKLISCSLRKIYQQIEDLKENHNREDARHQLESAQSLIRSLL